MSYAGSLTASLLRSAIAGRSGYTEGQAAGKSALAKAAADAKEERRKELLVASQVAENNRTAGLVDPNTPAALTAKNAAALKLHATNRLFDAAHPVSGEGTTGDKAAQRARSAYKARLMTAVPSKYPGGTPRPGMSEAEAEALVTEAWGPPAGSAARSPDTSTRSLMGGSILRGGGAARGSATSTPAKGVQSSSAPANAAGLNATGSKKTGGIDLSNSSALPTGKSLKERDMEPADLWDKKVGEGMSPEQATAYVHRMKGTG